MSLAKVTRNFQVTIPASIRKLLHIHEGTMINFSVKNGEVVLKPKVMIDEDQTWFWTKEWQQGEKEIEQARQKGDTLSFDSVKQMRKHFEK
ncbi:MAG: AbrB/MazE/SpoVT family DNA-binding domain-containing protein [Candidatus Omnitrophota bacterium]